MPKPKVKIHQAEATDLPFKKNSVDLVMGSPPYVKARNFNKTARLNCDQWVEWMLRVTQEGLRVSRGPVLWVAAGTGNYEPACEGLMWEARKLGIIVLRPCIWTKNAPPTGKGWFSNDWEYVMGFCNEKPLPHFDGEALKMEIKYKAGGHFRQKGKDGKARKGSDYPTHKYRKRPSNVFYVKVGGGHMGHPLAGKNEAPYPEKLVEPFIKCLTKKGDTVLDPFSGSGTTADVALQLGRKAIACDIRGSQVELTARRLEE